MPDRTPSKLPFDSGEPAEQGLWAALASVPRGEPSPELRRRFYRDLERSGSRPWPERLGAWLGLAGAGGWATAAASLLLGFGLALLVARPDAAPERLEALERSFAGLQRELILDRLRDPAASTRLQGVVEAASLASEDSEIARALLASAARDRSESVRSAAIDALGPRLRSGELGPGLMQLLEESESPLVQLALVDLVLRYGTGEQLRALQSLAESARLQPDIQRHVNTALGRQSI